MQNAVAHLISLWPRLIGDAAEITSDDAHALASLIYAIRDLPRGAQLFKESPQGGCALLMLEGILGRCHTMEPGARAILQFLVPGDFSNGDLEHGRYPECSLIALTKAKVALIPKLALRALCVSNPRIDRCLRALAAREQAISREWLVSRSRGADQRLAHLMCELEHRLGVVGLTRDHTFTLPLVQADIADAAGISLVHAARVLHHLQARRLIALKGKYLTVTEPAALCKLAYFAPEYLTGDDRARKGHASA